MDGVVKLGIYRLLVACSSRYLWFIVHGTFVPGFGSVVSFFEPSLRKPSLSSQANYASADLETLMAMPSPASLRSRSATAFDDDVSCP